MRIKFKCSHCSEEFRVEEKYLSGKERLDCPNCGASMPDAALLRIRQAVALLTEARKNLELPKPSNVITSRAFRSLSLIHI